MNIIKKIIERLKVCWHILTKENYAFFAVDTDALVFDIEGNYSHIISSKIVAYSDVNEIDSYITNDGQRTFYSFFWDSVKDFADMRLKDKIIK